MRSTSLLPSPCQDKVGHRRKMISELNTRPGCASVNASPEWLPTPTHHSRPRRLARSYLVRLFHSQLSSGLCRRTLSPFTPPEEPALSLNAIAIGPALAGRPSRRSVRAELLN